MSPASRTTLPQDTDVWFETRNPPQAEVIAGCCKPDAFFPQVSRLRLVVAVARIAGAVALRIAPAAIQSLRGWRFVPDFARSLRAAICANINTARIQRSVSGFAQFRRYQMRRTLLLPRLGT